VPTFNEQADESSFRGTHTVYDVHCIIRLPSGAVHHFGSRRRFSEWRTLHVQQWSTRPFPEARRLVHSQVTKAKRAQALQAWLHEAFAAYCSAGLLPPPPLLQFVGVRGEVLADVSSRGSVPTGSLPTGSSAGATQPILLEAGEHGGGEDREEHGSDGSSSADDVGRGRGAENAGEGEDGGGGECGSQAGGDAARSDAARGETAGAAAADGLPGEEPPLSAECESPWRQWWWWRDTSAL
jgi:hypothetical protein